MPQVPPIPLYIVSQNETPEYLSLFFSQITFCALTRLFDVNVLRFALDFSSTPAAFTPCRYQRYAPVLPLPVTILFTVEKPSLVINKASCCSDLSGSARKLIRLKGFCTYISIRKQCKSIFDFFFCCWFDPSQEC